MQEYGVRSAGEIKCHFQISHCLTARIIHFLKTQPNCLPRHKKNTDQPNEASQVWGLVRVPANKLCRLPLPSGAGWRPAASPSSRRTRDSCGRCATSCPGTSAACPPWIASRATRPTSSSSPSCWPIHWLQHWQRVAGRLLLRLLRARCEEVKNELSGGFPTFSRFGLDQR